MKLSVCIPVYNVAPYVEACARSLFGQTYRDIEYVFVDDGSTDGSMAIVERVLKDYPDRAGQVKILRHVRNFGLVATRMDAIRAATGHLITHCDSDDWADVDLYEKMIARLIERQADVVLCPARRHRGGCVRVVEIGADDMSGPDAMRRMDELPGLSAMMTKIFVRDRIDLNQIECPNSVSIAEDYCFTMQVLPRCRKMASISGSYYNYRSNENSITRSRNFKRIVDSLIQVFDILRRRVPEDLDRIPLRNLAREILFWGTAHGLLSASEFGTWRSRFAELDGRWNWSDKSLWGQRMMKLSKMNYWCARMVAPLVKRRIRDYM